MNHHWLNNQTNKIQYKMTVNLWIMIKIKIKFKMKIITKTKTFFK
jgi:hypothetical protein